MSNPDLNYLRAEMSMAQSNGESKAYQRCRDAIAPSPAGVL